MQWRVYIHMQTSNLYVEWLQTSFFPHFKLHHRIIIITARSGIFNFQRSLELSHYYKEIAVDQMPNSHLIIFIRQIPPGGRWRREQNEDTCSIFCYWPSCLLPQQPTGSAHSAVMIDYPWLEVWDRTTRSCLLMSSKLQLPVEQNLPLTCHAGYYSSWGPTLLLSVLSKREFSLNTTFIVCQWLGLHAQ